MRLLDKTGSVSTFMDVDELTGDIKVVTQQDVSGFLDHMAELRKHSADRWSQGKKEEWMLYAKIPSVVIMDLKNKGIDIFNPEDEKKVLRAINRDYPYLKTVDHKNHE